MRAFEEEQRFDQPWLWVIMGLAGIPGIGLPLFGCVKQLASGEPWGDKPMSDGSLLAFTLFIIVVFAAAVWMLAAARLYTSVDAHELRYRFKPFHRNAQLIRKEEIEQWEVRSYRPVVDYGGWGLRYSLGGKGRAFNVKGNMGLALTLRSGKKLLIGTQKAEELKTFLERHWR